MVDRSKYAEKGGGDDLKAKDFVGKNMKLVISHTEEVHFDATDSQPANDKLALHFEGKEKRLILNATNTETLINAYGADDDGWKGKEIALSTKDYSDKGFGHGWIVSALEVEFDDAIPF
jgi:hypothetical protein